MPSARRDQTRLPSLLANSLNATDTFWCSLRDAPSCVQTAAAAADDDGLMNGDGTNYFVKAGGLFSDLRYDTRVCASNARELRYIMRYIATTIVRTLATCAENFFVVSHVKNM